jgi:hypothetical protein
MNRHLNALVGLSAVALLAASPMTFAAEDTTPAMHMHKSEMDHTKKDSEVAAEYKSEATQLREKAEHHRKLARIYQTRSGLKSSGDYANVAKHCEKLAQYYDDAAKEADAVSSELGKQ